MEEEKKCTEKLREMFIPLFSFFCAAAAFPDTQEKKEL